MQFKITNTSSSLSSILLLLLLQHTICGFHNLRHQCNQ